jgi:hypothetical protein
MNVPAKTYWKESAEGLVEFHPNSSGMTKGLIGDATFDWEVGINGTLQMPAMLNMHYRV